jgi:hypothetical protein
VRRLVVAAARVREAREIRRAGDGQHDGVEGREVRREVDERGRRRDAELRLDVELREDGAMDEG